MKEFVVELKSRNEVLFYFGVICFLLCFLFLILSSLASKTIVGVNAWFKPFMFALSIALYSWTMAWFIFYLKNTLLTIAIGALYAMLSTFTFFVALKGRPLFNPNQSNSHAIIS